MLENNNIIYKLRLDEFNNRSNFSNILKKNLTLKLKGFLGFIKISFLRKNDIFIKQIFIDEMQNLKKFNFYINKRFYKPFIKQINHQLWGCRLAGKLN